MTASQIGKTKPDPKPAQTPLLKPKQMGSLLNPAVEEEEEEVKGVIHVTAVP